MAKKFRFVHGCPRCGGQITREAGFMTCLKCRWRPGEQSFHNHPTINGVLVEYAGVPPSDLTEQPGRRRTPLKFER
jgi:hypothetical protein